MGREGRAPREGLQQHRGRLSLRQLAHDQSELVAVRGGVGHVPGQAGQRGDLTPRGLQARVLEAFEEPLVVRGLPALARSGPARGRLEPLGVGQAGRLVVIGGDLLPPLVHEDARGRDCVAQPVRLDGLPQGVGPPRAQDRVGRLGAGSLDPEPPGNLPGALAQLHAAPDRLDARGGAVKHRLAQRVLGPVLAPPLRHALARAALDRLRGGNLLEEGRGGAKERKLKGGSDEGKEGERARRECRRRRRR